MSTVTPPPRRAYRTFLCCLPVRFGVVLLALMGFLGGSAIAAYAIISLKRSHGTSGDKVSMGIQTAVYLILAILSIVGLMGAIARKLTLVRSYFWMVFLHLLLSIGLGIYAIVHIFKDSSKYIDECASGSDDPSVLQTCQDGSKLFKGITITLFIVVWMIEIYACSIVHSYGKQLAEEQANKDNENW